MEQTNKQSPDVKVQAPYNAKLHPVFRRHTTWKLGRRLSRDTALGFKATYCVRTRQDIPEVGLSGPLAFAGCRIHFGAKPHAVVSGTDEASGLLLGPWICRS